ncbi:MAG: imidazoleglycerol-phosphate dehydratase HisB [Ruminococcaceae bacterium]|nr:imidazoleglycerol-phosphate dehydratase HisB [Oscillospiraceae bacterium]
MRIAKINRKTAETDISLCLNLDGTGTAKIDTGCGFLDHMLTLFAHHSGFDLEVKCKGDTDVDFHHTVEDIGIVLGDALAEALGDKKGITRYGSFLLPMDEALVMTAIDISGRGHLAYGLEIPAARVGQFDTELVQEFFISLARRAGITLHIRQLAGFNTHHIIEGAFKSVARSLGIAARIDPDKADAIPSTKGVL